METQTWEEIKSMNDVRWFPSAVVLDGRIYVASESGKTGNSVEMYDPKSDEWTEVAMMHKHRLLFTLIESNGFIFAMGGDPVIERYDPRENCWTMVRGKNCHSYGFHQISIFLKISFLFSDWIV